jgi:hypothetical protein
MKNLNNDGQRTPIEEEKIFQTLSRVRPDWKRELLGIIGGLAIAGLMIYGYETYLV